MPCRKNLRTRRRLWKRPSKSLPQRSNLQDTKKQRNEASQEASFLIFGLGLFPWWMSGLVRDTHPCPISYSGVGSWCPSSLLCHTRLLRVVCLIFHVTLRQIPDFSFLSDVMPAPCCPSYLPCHTPASSWFFFPIRCYACPVLPVLLSVSCFGKEEEIILPLSSLRGLDLFNRYINVL